MKRAQISQVFVFIISAIVIVAVLGFGVNSIFKLSHDVSKVQCLKFKEDLKAKLTENKAYGSVDDTTIKVDCDYREICFISAPVSGNSQSDFSEYPIIKDSADSRVKQNVFFRNSITEDFYYIEDLRVGNDGEGIICQDVTNGRLNLHFKGKGSYVELIEDFSSSSSSGSGSSY